MATAFSIDSFLGSPALVRARAVEKGLPYGALKAVLSDGTVSIADLVGVVASRRTLDRRLADKGFLTLEESDRLTRFAEVLALTVYVMGDSKSAMEWLRDPQFDFDGTPPIQLMRTHTGSDLVVNLLQRFRHGMLA